MSLYTSEDITVYMSYTYCAMFRCIKTSMSHMLCYATEMSLYTWHIVTYCDMSYIAQYAYKDIWHIVTYCVTYCDIILWHIVTYCDILWHIVTYCAMSYIAYAMSTTPCIQHPGCCNRVNRVQHPGCCNSIF